jgi:hypothetical protein
MSEHFEKRKNEVALRRFAAVSFIEQKLREGFGVVEALRLAALRPWADENGRYSAARTLEDYWYAWKSGGFATLQPKAVVIKGFSQAAGRSRSMALEPSKSVCRDCLRALDPSRSTTALASNHLPVPSRQRL